MAAASHELKAPLAVIMANAEALQDIQSHNNSAPQSQACLDVIDAECSRMSRLVRDMLMLASSDADKWTIQKSEINVDTLLISLYEAYEPDLRKFYAKLLFYPLYLFLTCGRIFFKNTILKTNATASLIDQIFKQNPGF